MPDKHLRKQPKEVPATVDRDVEDNSFDWQRAGGGSDVEAIGEAGQTPGQGEPTESSPVQPGPDRPDESRPAGGQDRPRERERERRNTDA
jgi:hypothetical protein